MKKIILLFICILTIVGCSNTDIPERLEEENVRNVSSVSTEISIKEDFGFSDKIVKMEEVVKIDDKLNRDAYYGVPIKINEEYYKIPAVKIMDYYFIDMESLSNMIGLKYNISDEEIKINSLNDYKINVENISSGNISPESINIDDVTLITDNEILAINYKDNYYISLISLEEYLNSDKFYFNRSLGAITNIKPDNVLLDINDNGLLRKNISIDDEREFIVRESLYGKMLVICDIYGSYLNITPNNLEFATDLQNVFLHKTNDTIYMFGLLGNSIEVYNVNIDKELNIDIKSIGSIQRSAQNIYYLGNRYVAVGREGIYGIEINNNNLKEINLPNIINIKETSGDFNIIENNYYFTIKDQFGDVNIYKFDINNFKLDLFKSLEFDIAIDEAPKNFFYSFVENNNISIYLQDNSGYVHNIIYKLKEDNVEFLETDKFRLFYDEKKYPVELAIKLLKSNQSGNSDLTLNINGNSLGNNVILFGVEDDWVYCSEYVEQNGKYSTYGFRYNALTGIKDYFN